MKIRNSKVYVNDYKKMKIILFFLIILFESSLLNGKIIDDFDTFNSSYFQPTDNITPSYSSAIYHTESGALKLVRNIAYDSSTGWVEVNEVIEKLPSSIDLSSFDYFLFWYYDDSMLTGNNASVIQIGIYDGDEWWYTTQTISAIGWGQMVVPLKALDTTNVDYIKGFALPTWETKDPTYVGNGVFNKEKISQMKFSFGAHHKISGNFYIDDMKAINLIAKSIPENNAYISANVTVKIYFGDKMNKSSVEEISNVKIYDKVSDTELSKTLSYNNDNNILTINNLSLNDNRFYEIVLTNLLFYDNSSADSYHINFSTQYPKTVYPDYSYIIQDYTDGSYLDLPENSVNDIISVINLSSLSTASISEFPALKYKEISPVGEKLKESGRLIFFTDGLENYENLFVYMKEGDKWKKVPSIWNKDEGYIEAVIDKLGDYALTFSDYESVNENVLSVNLSSNPFTPNNDGKNDKSYFNLVVASGGDLTIKIYNSNGDCVKTIVKDYSVKSGVYNKIFYWDGKNDNGDDVPTGIYIYTVEVKSDTSNASEYYVWYENAPNTTKIKGVIAIAR